MKFSYSVANIFKICFTHLVPAKVISDAEIFLKNETNPVTFSCQATGEPVPTINWYFNGIMINTSNTSKYNISNSISGKMVTSVITIVSVQSADGGTYTCHAVNIIGSDESTGILRIHGKCVAS